MTPLRPCCSPSGSRRRCEAFPIGLEPITFGSGGRRSIQLSYGNERLAIVAKRPRRVRVTESYAGGDQGWRDERIGRARRRLNPRGKARAELEVPAARQ